MRRPHRLCAREHSVTGWPDVDRCIMHQGAVAGANLRGLDPLVFLEASVDQQNVAVERGSASNDGHT